MGINLPRAGAGSVGEGGGARTAALPDAGDVPRVSVASDPGVQIPDTTQFAGGLGDVGAVASDIGDRVIANEELAITQREGVARDTDDISYFEQLNAHAAELDAGADHADDQVITAAGQFGKNLKQQILNDHPGGELSKMMLSVQLDRRFASFTNTLSGKNVVARRSQLQGSVDGRIRGIVADMGVDPGVPLEERFGQVDEAIAFLGLPPAMAETARDQGRQELATARLNEIIRQADIDENGFMIGARALLENPLLREVLPSTVRSGFANRVFEIENTIQRVGLEAQAEVAGLDEVAETLGLEGQDKRDFIIGVMAPGIGKSSDKQAALDRLVGSGTIDQNTADKIMSGSLRVAQIRNEAGDLENVLVDFTQVGGSGGVTPISEVGGEAPPPAAGTPAEAAPVAPAVVTSADEPEPAAPDAQSIFGIVAGPTAVTGLVPSVTGSVQGITGQFGVDVAPAEQLLLQKTIDNAQIALTQALVPNDRFPVAQVKFVLKQAAIERGPGTDRRTLLSSIVALDSVMLRQQEQAEADAQDESLPNDVRQAQAQNASEFRNFRAVLGVPPGTTAADIEALGEPEKGGINEFIEGVRSFIESGGDEAAGGDEAPKPISEVPPVDEINKMNEDEVRSLVQSLDRSAPITADQVNAIKKILGVE